MSALRFLSESSDCGWAKFLSLPTATNRFASGSAIAATSSKDELQHLFSPPNGDCNRLVIFYNFRSAGKKKIRRYDGHFCLDLFR